MSSNPTHVRRRKPMSSTAKALSVLGVLVLVLAGAGAGALLWFQHQLNNNIERLGDPFAAVSDRPTPAPADADGNQAVNFLVLGSDSRISAGDPSQWKAGAQRTDAIMLVHLPGDRKSAQVVSIPRDSWVPIPGHGRNKINAAFSFGGPSLMIETVEQLTHVPIDHFIVTDFTSFTNMTDALGGVRITIPEDTGDGNGVFFSAGVHEMNGDEALTYARQRHGLANGDFGRVQRQQNWMRAILAKVNNSRNDLGTMTNFFQVVSRSVAADDDFTIDRMRELFLSARGLSTNDVQFMTAPYVGTARSPDGQSIVELDQDRFDELMAAIHDDSAQAYITDNADELETLPANVK